MFRIIKTSARRNFLTVIKISILLIGIVILFDIRVIDNILSGASEKIAIINDDLESFRETDAIETGIFYDLRKRKSDHQVATNAVTQPKPLCQEYPANLVKKVSFCDATSSPPTLEDIKNANPKVVNGGHFTPDNCVSRHRVAIIIPYRDRERHLRIFLAHMHPIWQRQQLDYKVFVINQAGNESFNRAKLMNIGVAEAEKDGQFDCYVFQDVDLLLEDDRCLYWCHRDNPRHLSMYVDKFSYKRHEYILRCPPLSMSIHETIPVMGGVTMLSREQFRTVNGFSNLYWGWGGEDDDLYMRIKNKGYLVENPYGKHCSFRMIKHVHSSGSPINNASLPLIFHAMSRMDIEGYRSLRYRLLSVDEYSLYTNITVDVGRPSAKMKDFMTKNMNFGWLIGCRKKMPWES